jgi:hypothetical protein
VPKQYSIKLSAIAVLLPATGSSKAATGEPYRSGNPFFSVVIQAITPQLFNGNCNGPVVCCLAYHPHNGLLYLSTSLYKLPLLIEALALNKLKSYLNNLNRYILSIVVSVMTTFGELQKSSKAKSIGLAPVVLIRK